MALLHQMKKSVREEQAKFTFIRQKTDENVSAEISFIIDEIKSHQAGYGKVR